MPSVYIAIPLLNEKETIINTIISLSEQTYKDTQIIVCINQPDEWWDIDSLRPICYNNIETIKLLKSRQFANLQIIDRCSQGQGVGSKQKGVGWARKILFDNILEYAKEDDIVISADADTIYKNDYVEKIVEAFNFYPNISGISSPYYHLVNQQDESTNRAILRYEIYMRYYLINTYIYNLKYTFTALGSAIAFRINDYKRIRGIKPVEAGEDFYLLQKLMKTGSLLNYIDSCVYPSSRQSDRVNFGTGKAVIKGVHNDWSSYPFYPIELFEKIEQFYQLIPEIYKQNVETPIDEFLNYIFKQDNIWDNIRNNFKTLDKFTTACYQKFDALRINQFLKYSYKNRVNDNINLIRFANTHLQNEIKATNIKISEFDFQTSPIETINKLRDILFLKEMELRKNNSLLKL